MKKLAAVVTALLSASALHAQSDVAVPGGNVAAPRSVPPPTTDAADAGTTGGVPTLGTVTVSTPRGAAAPFDVCVSTITSGSQLASRRLNTCAFRLSHLMKSRFRSRWRLLPRKPNCSGPS